MDEDQISRAADRLVEDVCAGVTGAGLALAALVAAVALGRLAAAVEKAAAAAEQS